MKATIDRFEGEYAVLEYNDKMINFHRSLLPAQVKEGDSINIKITIDNDSKETTKKRIEKLVNDVWET